MSWWTAGNHLVSSPNSCLVYSSPGNDSNLKTRKGIVVMERIKNSDLKLTIVMKLGPGTRSRQLRSVRSSHLS